LYELLTKAKYPARNPLQNVNDLKAQIAACEKGAQEMRKMVAHFSLKVVHAYMKHVQDNADESVRRVIGRLHDSSFTYEMPTRAMWSRSRSQSTRRNVKPPSISPVPRRSRAPISTRPSR
jgi:N-methylhydantoinase B/oxoprolinase/acetone carboxylase alpha subunit